VLLLLRLVRLPQPSKVTSMLFAGVVTMPAAALTVPFCLKPVICRLSSYS
jgi:hypothetical protein